MYNYHPHGANFDPYLTSNKEDYYEKQQNLNCDADHKIQERGLDRLYAYTSGTTPTAGGRPTSYTYDYGKAQNHDYSKQPFARPEIRPTTTFYQSQRELDQAAQRVYRPTSEYRDQYMGARPAMQPAGYSGMQFSGQFDPDFLPRDERSSQHRIHDRRQHAQNPYLGNPQVPTTLAKSASSAKMHSPRSREESTTYGAVHSRPFTGVCAHGKTPQNYTEPGYIHPTCDVHKARMPPPPPHTERPQPTARSPSPGDDDIVYRINDLGLVSVPMLVPDFEIEPDNESSRYYEPAPQRRVSQQFAAAQDNGRNRPPTSNNIVRPPPAAARQHSASPPPAPRRPTSPRIDQQQQRGYQQQDLTNNPYGAIPHVHIKRMPVPETDDPRFDMGDRPSSPPPSYSYRDQQVYQAPTADSVLRRGGIAAKSHETEDKFNMTNVESILRDADALSQNIRHDMANY